jgi:hypothetical protein
MDNISEKIKTFKYTLKKKKYSIKISIKNNFINFFIEEIDSIPPMKYETNLSEENLKGLSKYFLMFDNIEESFNDIEKLMNNKSYEFKEDNNLIIIYFKTGIINKNFKIEIPNKKIEIEERIEELTQIIKKQQNEINLLKQIHSIQEYNKLLDRCNKLEKLIKFNNENIFRNFNDSILLDYREKNIIIDKLKEYYFYEGIKDLGLGISKMQNSDYYIDNFITNFISKYDLQNNISEELVKKFISKNIDISKCTIITKLLYRASVNGDSIENFHKYCDNHGPIITVIKTEQGKTFAAFYNKFNYNLYLDKKTEDCFIIFLDTGERSEPENCYYDEKKIQFGNLVISDSCLSNQNSCIGKVNFKVIDYEVFSIYFNLFN